MRNFVAERIQNVPPSGIRKFFDIAATMDDVISLGIGEPDFVTPAPFLEAGIRSLREGKTQYTSNSGILELRQLLSSHLHRLYAVRYDPELRTPDLGGSFGGAVSGIIGGPRSWR